MSNSFFFPDTTFAPRQRPKLHPHAVPKINPKDSAFCARQLYESKYHDKNYSVDEDFFTNANEYSVAGMSYHRTIQQQQQHSLPPQPTNQLNPDRIENFEELKTYVQENNIRSDLNWQRVCTNDTICFFVVNAEDRPYLEVSVKIGSDFSVTGWKGNVSMKRSMLKQLLGRDAKCDTYSKLHGMLGVLRCRESCENLTIMKVENVQSNGVTPKPTIKQHSVDDDTEKVDVNKLKFRNVTIMKVARNTKSKVRTDEYEDDDDDNSYLIPEITYETIELD